MSTNKHAQIRYIALDKCFSNFGRKYFIEDLVEACNVAIYEFTGKSEGVKKRQVYEDIKFMESSQGWHVELDRIKDMKKVFHRYVDRNYSINKSPLNQVEITQINEVLLTLSRFKGLPQFEWIDEISNRLQSISKQDIGKIIDFEQNQFLKGLELITPLFNAIYNHRALAINYTAFKGESSVLYQIHPYYLKQYNLRWFVFGLNEQSNQITNLALDRITDLTELAIKFKENQGIDFNEYFDDIVGVTIIKTKPVEKITILVSDALWPYVKTKPIHGSQMPPIYTDTGILIEINVIVNYELIAKLLSYGDGLTIISPESLVNELKIKVESMRNNYL